MDSRSLESAVSPLKVFGAMLRHYRVSAGMSQEQLGALLYCSGDLIGKIENGQRAPTEQFTAACEALADLKTGGALMELRELLKHYLKERAFPGWFHDWPGNESHATALRTFELVAVPGLLQTEEYARAMLCTQVMASVDETDEMVAARMDRQAILSRDKPPMLWVLLDEGVLRRYSTGNGGNCVEVALNLPPAVAVRDSKDPEGTAVLFSAPEWRAFIAATKDGEFGLAQ
jgi:transcriptional regulator with XRE-family HTH domain